MTARILVFARAPVAGVAKTRLIPALGRKGAAALQSRLVQDAVARAVAAQAGIVELWGTGEDPEGLLAECAATHGVALCWQGEGDLGARMQTALARATDAGDPAVIIGSDCPALAPPGIAAAVAALARHDAVLGPATDGGYVLLGLHHAARELFRDVPWGTGEVLAVTRERLAGLGWRWTELTPRSDVDVPADLPAVAALGPAWRERLNGLGWCANGRTAGGKDSL